jgi:glycosyltransferase involved in cell wall biosynthesis
MADIQLQQGPTKVFKKTILFLAPAQDCCMDKVIMEYAPHLMEQGYTVLVTPEPRFGDALQYAPEIIVLFRCGTQDFGRGHLKQLIGFINYMKSYGVKIVYYADDLIFHLQSGQPLYLARAADRIIVATTALEGFLRERGFTQPIQIVPTHMDILRFDEISSTPMPAGKIRVLLASTGRVGALTFYQMCEKMNETPEKYKDVEFHVVASSVAQFRSIVNKFRGLHKVYHEWMKLAEFIALIKASDIMLSPAIPQDVEYLVPPNLSQLWLDSKSCVKYNLAGAASIPIISAPTAEYKTYIKHGVTGYLADNAEEFIKYLDMLIEDPNLRMKIGIAARDDIIENFDIRKRAPMFIDALQGIGVVSSVAKYVFIPPGEGGPSAFSTNMSIGLARETKGTWGIVSSFHEGINYMIIPAFIGHEMVDIVRGKTPTAKLIHRMDGLPFVSPLIKSDQKPGELQENVLLTMKDLYNKSNYIVWQSEFAKRSWRQYVDVDSKPNKVIYNGIDQTIFRPEVAKFPLASQKTKILHVNHSVFLHKRMDLLYQAIESFPDIDFILVGYYDTLDMAESYMKFAKYSNVIYMGHITDNKMLAALYAACNATLFTSEMEGCPHVALESLSVGKPVLYNDAIDVVPEISEVGTFGWSSMETLTAAIEDAKEFTGKIDMSKYSNYAMAKQYLEVLESL